MIHLGSAGVADVAFIEQFEACTYPNDRFHHEDHLRLAWLYLERLGCVEAELRMAESIHRFATSLAASEKYHHTMTIAWVRLVDAARRLTPQLYCFENFAAAHPWLTDRNALLAFYSREVLSSTAARAGWIEPDVHPLPVAQAHLL